MGLMCWILLPFIVVFIGIAIIIALLYRRARINGYFPPPLVGTQSVIVITGCDSGIGRETAMRFASLGYHVVVSVLNSENGESLKKTAKGEISYFTMDITKEDSIKQFGCDVGNLLSNSNSNKKLVGLVNNAGVAVMGPLEFITHSNLKFQLDVNLVGHNTTTSVLLPYIRQSRGRIVNIVSVAGRCATVLMGPYNASKFGMEAISDVMRQELRKFGISVSAVEPGFIRTPMVQRVANEWDAQWDRLSPEAKELYATDNDRGRHGMAFFLKNAASPSIVADAITHALTAERPQTRYLVGHDAKLYAFFAWALPDRMRDALFDFAAKYAARNKTK